MKSHMFHYDIKYLCYTLLIYFDQLRGSGVYELYKNVSPVNFKWKNRQNFTCYEIIGVSGTTRYLDFWFVFVFVCFLFWLGFGDDARLSLKHGKL